MNLSKLTIAVLLVVPSAQADRFVMKDNSVRTGKLTGMENGAFVVNSLGRVERIPVADVSLLVLDDSAPPASSSIFPAPSPPRGNAPTANVGVIDPVAPVVSQFSQTVEGFRVDLDRCIKQASKSVTCSFRITNTETDREVGVHGQEDYYQRTYYVDDRGMQRYGISAKLGSKSGIGPETASITDVPITGSIEFPGVEAGVNSLAKLVIGCFLPRQREFVVEFRKIPLQGN